MASNQLVNSINASTVPIFAGSEVIEFEVDGFESFDPIFVYANGINISPFCAPSRTEKIGNTPTADQQGRASGVIYLPSTDGKWKFLSGEIVLSFGDSPISLDSCTRFAESVIYNHGVNLVSTEQGTTLSLRATEKIRYNSFGVVLAPDTINPSNPENNTYLGPNGTRIPFVPGYRPLSQSFVVDSGKYPNGIFLTSLDLYFFTKDTFYPVTVELRPMSNWAPSNSEYFSGSSVTVYPQDILIYNAAAKEAIPTEFKFDHPIYLNPGEYCFSVITKSKSYALVSASSAIPGAQAVGENHPYTGKLWKINNSSDYWSHDPAETLMFKLKKAKFETGTKTFLMKNNRIVPIDYNRLRMLSTAISLGDNAYADYRVQTLDSTTRQTDGFEDVLPNGELNIIDSKRVDQAGDILVEIALTSKSPDISPMLDRQLTKAQVYKNKIDAYSQAISESELTAKSGLASARYVGRVVTLQEGFDSTGLEVSIDVNRRIGTDIEIFARVLSREDKVLSGGISERPWKLLPLSPGQTKSFVGTDNSTFVKETYRLLDPDLSYSYTGEELVLVSDSIEQFNFDSFGYYQIKVVFYSSNPNVVPKIKNLVATAVL